MPLDWKPTIAPFPPGGVYAMRDACALEVRLMGDGVYHLLIWKGRSSSIGGIFHAVEVAKLAAETVPLDRKAMIELARDPHGQFRFGENA